MTRQDLLEKLKSLHKSLDVEKIADYPDHADSKDWLADIPSILKNFDDSDFRSFCNYREQLLDEQYPWKRKIIVNKMDVFIRQKISEYEIMLNLEKKPQKIHSELVGIFIPYPKFILRFLRFANRGINKIKNWFSEHRNELLIAILTGVIATVIGGAILYFFGWI